MKLYKFRPLRNELDLYRIKEILADHVFWHSKFWELNDPMEGVFTIENNEKRINEIFDSKSKYGICSFSGLKGFENPILGGYYANGFKGLAIEIEVDTSYVKHVKYPVSLNEINNSNPDSIEMVLRTKLKNWEHENEFRSLNKGIIGNIQVGKISGVYFGNPYGNVQNKYVIQKKFMKYIDFKNKVIETANKNNILCYNVKMIDGKVVKDPDVVQALTTAN